MKSIMVLNNSKNKHMKKMRE